MTIFSQRIDPMLLQEKKNQKKLRHHFLIIIKRKEKPTGLWQARNNTRYANR